MYNNKPWNNQYNNLSAGFFCARTPCEVPFTNSESSGKPSGKEQLQRNINVEEHSSATAVRRTYYTDNTAVMYIIIIITAGA